MVVAMTLPPPSPARVHGRQYPLSPSSHIQSQDIATVFMGCCCQGAGACHVSFLPLPLREGGHEGEAAAPTAAEAVISQSALTTRLWRRAAGCILKPGGRVLPTPPKAPTYVHTKYTHTVPGGKGREISLCCCLNRLVMGLCGCCLRTLCTQHLSAQAGVYCWCWCFSWLCGSRLLMWCGAEDCAACWPGLI